ncbi:MAG TPA: hypothetical protein VK901_06780 [Nitrospiraceae bacterium]|nr:hypothetical protein [Nitrospiraceae bacterium]
MQVTVTSRVISRFGLASALVVLPVASAIVRRVGEYTLAKPAREVLFTVVSREEKYKLRTVSIQRFRVRAMRRLGGL